MSVLRTFHLKPKSIGRISVNGYRSLRNYSNKSMELITYCEKSLVFPTATHKSTRHEYAMAFMGCHFHGCQMCFDLSTMNTHLNKSMGDLYRETMRCIARVTNIDYMLSVMWKCEREILSKSAMKSRNM